MNFVSTGGHFGSDTHTHTHTKGNKLLCRKDKRFAWEKKQKTEKQPRKERDKEENGKEMREKGKISKRTDKKEIHIEKRKRKKKEMKKKEKSKSSLTQQQQRHKETNNILQNNQMANLNNFKVLKLYLIFIGLLISSIHALQGKKKHSSKE